MLIQLSNLKPSVSTRKFEITIFTLGIDRLIKFIFSYVFTPTRYDRINKDFYTNIVNTIYAITYCRIYGQLDNDRCKRFANRISTIGYPDPLRRIISMMPLNGEHAIMFSNIITFKMSDSDIKRTTDFMGKTEISSILLDIVGTCKTNNIGITNEDIMLRTTIGTFNVFLGNRNVVTEAVYVEDKKKVRILEKEAVYNTDIFLPTMASPGLTFGFLFFNFFTPLVPAGILNDLLIIFNLKGKAEALDDDEIITVTEQVAKNMFEVSIAEFKIEDERRSLTNAPRDVLNQAQADRNARSIQAEHNTSSQSAPSGHQIDSSVATTSESTSETSAPANSQTQQQTGTNRRNTGRGRRNTTPKAFGVTQSQNGMFQITIGDTLVSFSALNRAQ